MGTRLEYLKHRIMTALNYYDVWREGNYLVWTPYKVPVHSMLLSTKSREDLASICLASSRRVIAFDVQLSGMGE